MSTWDPWEILGHCSEGRQGVFGHRPPIVPEPCPQAHRSAKLFVSQGGNKSFKRLFENALWHMGLQALAEQMGKLVYLKISKASHFLSPCFLNVLNTQKLGFPNMDEGHQLKWQLGDKNLPL